MTVDELKALFNRFKACECTAKEYKQVRTLIEQMQEEEHGNILYLHYINGQTWLTIARDAPADVSTVHRWNNALMRKAVLKIGTGKGV